MTQKEINSYYKKFKISEDMVPDYQNPRDFALQFKRCTILKDVDTTYTNSTSESKINKVEDKDA
ncbi:hypothetical protein ACFL4A_00025 [bacterium]